MSNQNPSLAGNFESTAQQMLEALDRAGGQLSETVNACMEQLSTYNLGLQKSLSDQLQHISERFHSFVEANQEDLENNKDRLLEKLAEFERSEVETIVAAARGVRQSLSAHTEQAETKISKLVEEKLAELRTTLGSPGEKLPERASSTVAESKEIAGKGQEKIDRVALSEEEMLASMSREREQELQELVGKWKEHTEDRIGKTQTEFQEKSNCLVEELRKLVDEGVSDLKRESDQGAETIARALESGQAKLTTQLQQWREELAQLWQSFDSSLVNQKEAFSKKSRSQLDSKLSEARSEIDNNASEARDRIRSSHRVLQGSLKRLEQDYRRRLEAALNRFQITLSETARRGGTASGLEQRTASALQEKLTAQLNARGADILKVFRKLSEQLQVEYARSTQGLDERIDHLKVGAIESLERQVHLTKGELEKILRGYQTELSELEINAAQIEEAGKAAAVTVMAFRSAMLSLESD